MAAGTRPLSLGEILDRTVQIYRRNFLLLVGISAPPAALLVAISGTLVLFFSSRVFELAQAGRGRSSPPVFGPEMAALGLVSALYLLIGVPLILGVLAVAFAALNSAASRVNRGAAATIRDSYGYAFRHFWRHVGILFLEVLLAWVVPYFVLAFVLAAGAILAALVARSGVGTTLWPLLVVLLVVWILAWLALSVLIWLRFSLAYPVSVAENIGSWPSLKRSNLLSQGSRGRIFVMFLLVFVLTIVASLALSVPLDIAIALFVRKSLTGGQPPTVLLTLMQVANLAAGFLVRVFVMPIYSTALVLFYIDQRTRLEGYDIEQLMVRAGWSQLPPHPPPPQNSLPDSGSPETGEIGAGLPSGPEGTDA